MVRPTDGNEPSNMQAFKLNVLFLLRDGIWIGQCLQHDIAVQGDNLPECMQELGAVLVGRIAVATKLGTHPFEGVPPAPAKYWRYYEQSLKLSVDETAFELPEGTPPAFMLKPSDLDIRVFG